MSWRTWCLGLVVGAAVVAGLGCPRRPEAPPPPPQGELGGSGRAPGEEPAGGAGAEAGEVGAGAGDAGEGAGEGEGEGEARAGEAARGEGFEAGIEAISGAPRGRGRPGTASVGGCAAVGRSVGERWQVECNTCTCEASGAVTCTVMACSPTAADPRR